MIREWRLKKQQEEDDKDDEDDSLGFDKLEEAASKPLKWDNIIPDEVVEIINDYQADSKKEYILYQESSNLSDVALVKEVKKKINELEEIFKNESHKMEWEHIRQEVIYNIKREQDLKNVEDTKAWMMKTNNFLMLGHKIIIDRAEKSEILHEYIILNEDFKKWLKDKNWKQDEKEVGEKRPMMESPGSRSFNESEEKKEDVKTRIKGMWCLAFYIEVMSFHVKNILTL